MKKLIGLISLALLMVACDRIEGTLTLNDEVTLVNTKGKTKTIAVNTYKADMKLKSKKSLTLRLENDSAEQYEFKIPSNKPVPNNGEFAFSAKEVGQSVDVAGFVKTNSSRSNVQTAYEMCQYTDYQTVCNSGPDGRVVCSTVPVMRQGQELVRFYIETTVKNISMQIKLPGSETSSGDFNGDIAYSQKVYTEKWGCR